MVHISREPVSALGPPAKLDFSRKIPDGGCNDLTEQYMTRHKPRKHPPHKSYIAGGLVRKVPQHLGEL
jgi:hypothetical protein